MLRKTVGPLHWFRSRLRLYAQLKFVGDNCVGHLSIASRKGNGKPIDSVCHGKAAKFEPAGQQRGITAAGSRFGDAKRDGRGGRKSTRACSAVVLSVLSLTVLLLPPDCQDLEHATKSNSGNSVGDNAS